MALPQVLVEEISKEYPDDSEMLEAVRRGEMDGPAILRLRPVFISFAPREILDASKNEDLYQALLEQCHQQERRLDLYYRWQRAALENMRTSVG